MFFFKHWDVFVDVLVSVYTVIYSHERNRISRQFIFSRIKENHVIAGIYFRKRAIKISREILRKFANIITQIFVLFPFSLQSKRRTKTVLRSVAPCWNQTFMYVLRNHKVCITFCYNLLILHYLLIIIEFLYLLCVITCLLAFLLQCIILYIN